MYPDVGTEHADIGVHRGTPGVWFYCRQTLPGFTL